MVMTTNCSAVTGVRVTYSDGHTEFMPCPPKGVANLAAKMRRFLKTVRVETVGV